MNKDNDKDAQESASPSRRKFVAKMGKAAIGIPAVILAVKATTRPAQAS